MARYPYTYAADLIRSASETPISRSDASRIWHTIASICGIDEEETAKKLADYYLANESSITETAVSRIIYKMVGDI